MLTKIPFYPGITRKATVAFGALFSNLYITPKKAGVTEKIVKVPIAYANKDKYIVKLQGTDPDLDNSIQVTLPRASFEITNISYDSSRQLNKVCKVISSVGNSTVIQYAPVPYTLEFVLNTYTKTSDENFQIMEQILPFFTPDLNLKVKMQADPEIVQDVPVVLNSVFTDDQYDGDMQDRRMIITTYTFSVKVNYHGPLKGFQDPENHFNGSPANEVIKKVYVNVNNMKYSVEVDPLTANENDPFTLNESWRETIPRDFDGDLSI